MVQDRDSAAPTARVWGPLGREEQGARAWLSLLLVPTNGSLCPELHPPCTGMGASQLVQR